MKKKWTRKEIESHLTLNINDYSAAVVCGALFKKLYGEYPKIGLSGFQASAIDSLQEVLPDKLESE